MHKSSDEYGSSGEYQSSRRLFSLKALLTVPIVAALATFAFFSWADLYQSFLETSRPEITILEKPRGIGITPVSVVFRVSDLGSGLDEVVVRVRQRNTVRELLRESLADTWTKRINVDFPGPESGLEQGNVEVEIRAFDRSFWNNGAEERIALKVDYRRPQVEVLTTQNNIRVGGSQVIFYRAYDESLALSGVKVGNKVFTGFPARFIDKSFDDENLHVAIYAVALGDKPEKAAPKVFADDEVGNSNSASFYHKILPRRSRPLTVRLPVEFMRERVPRLAAQNLAKLESMMGTRVVWQHSSGSPERLIETFKLVNGPLRELNSNEIVRLLKGRGYERFWEGHFRRQQSTVLGGFGDVQRFYFNGEKIDTAPLHGYELSVPRHDRSVIAMNEGVVAFVRDLGVYGKTIAVAHGLGLVTLYSRLGEVTLHEGDRVRLGEVLGSAGKSGISRSLNYYSEFRVHGVPVDPREWWDPNWYNSHVTGKINEVKRLLGIPVRQGLRF